MTVKFGFQFPYIWGRVAALVTGLTSMGGLTLIEKTTEQTTETMLLAPNQ